jgi:hypothetical protein
MYSTTSRANGWDRVTLLAETAHDRWQTIATSFEGRCLVTQHALGGARALRLLQLDKFLNSRTCLDVS